MYCSEFSNPFVRAPSHQKFFFQKMVSKDFSFSTYMSSIGVDVDHTVIEQRKKH
jgi:hypothetical protein